MAKTSRLNSDTKNVVWQLYLEGKSQHAIASRTGLSQMSVSRILDMVYQELRPQQLDPVDYQNLVLSKYDKMESELWDQWHASCEAGAPNPVFMQIIARINETRAKIAFMPSRSPLQQAQASSQLQEKVVILLPDNGRGPDQDQ